MQQEDTLKKRKKEKKRNIIHSVALPAGMSRFSLPHDRDQIFSIKKKKGIKCMKNIYFRMHKGTMINEADVTNMSLKKKYIKICNVSACIRVTHFEIVKAERVFRKNKNKRVFLYGHALISWLC